MPPAPLFCDRIPKNACCHNILCAVLLQWTENAVFQQIAKIDLYGRKKRPQRRKSRPKPTACLCPTCMLALSACARCEIFQVSEAGF